MKVKLGTLIGAEKALEKLNNTSGLKSVIAYRIMKNVAQIKRELHFYEEQRIRLCEEYAEKNDGKAIIENGNYVFTETGYGFFVKEIQELIDSKVDVCIEQLKLEDIDCAGLSPNEISLIDFMLILV